MNKGLIIGIICLAIVSVIAIVVSKPGKTRQPLTYIRSTGDLYLVCEFGKPLSTTKLLSEATPFTFTECPGGYCLMSDNQNVRISPGGIGGMILTDGVYTIYIPSLTETTYLGLVGFTAKLSLKPFGFGYNITASDANIWNVVKM